MKDAIGSEIAIVGMAGRFPEAPSVLDFWTVLREGREALRRYTDDELREAGVPYTLRSDPAFVPVHGAVDHVAAFDAEFFGLSPQDAAIMDPQHRIFLETVWTALENAAIDPARCEDAIGVFAGCGMNTYFQDHLSTNPDLIERLGYFHVRHTGNDKDFLATRVSYAFNLKGPSVSVQTACSTSLVAVHMATQSLLSGECDVAVAGGSTIELKDRFGYLHQEGGIQDPTGHCRAFDADSKGTVFGSGSGAVILKRYRDAVAEGDRIHAVIRSTAVNNDGAQKVGYLAPSVDGQAAAAAEALALSGVDPSTISYIECHGTGTPVGDPIELAALTQAYGSTVGGGACTIGSVKTNIGHLDTAAGVAGLIKTVLMLSNRQLVPSLHYRSPNPKLELERRPFVVGTKTERWQPDAGVRRAGVNALGVGGTNAHVIIEEAPPTASARRAAVPTGDRYQGPESTERAPRRRAHAFPLAARTPEALDRMTDQLGTWFDKHPDASLSDVAYTLQTGRAEWPYRRVVAAMEAGEAARICKDAPPPGPPAPDQRSIGFLFPGGGAQYPGMAQGLYATEAVFRQTVDAGLKILGEQEGLDLRNVLFPPPDAEKTLQAEMARPSVALPALCLIEIAMARLWQSWGVEPDGMIGHSAGEYAAAHVAGVFSLSDALRLMALRGRLFETLPAGGMLSVPMAAEEVNLRLPEGLAIATVNAASMCVVSGTVPLIEAFEEELLAEGVDVKRVPIDVAAHSPMVDQILGEYRTFVESLSLNTPQVRFASNLSGTWITDDEATNPEYWVRHLRQTVRFADGVRALLEMPKPFLLEMGPGHTLTTFADIHPDRPDDLAVSTTMRHPKDDTADDIVCLSAFGALWAAGGAVDWSAVRVSAGQPVTLPTYPFARDTHWVEPGADRVSVKDTARRENVDTFFALPSWAPQPLAARSRAIDNGETWLVFADGRRAPALIERARREGIEVIVVERGRAFHAHSAHRYALDPVELDQYQSLIEHLGETADAVSRVVHCWNVTGDTQPTARALDSAGGGWRSLFLLLKAIGDAALTQAIDMDVVADSVHALAGDAHLHPLKATLWGPVRVGPREIPNLACRVVDLPAQGVADETLWRELVTGAPGQTVAYRSGRRFVPTTESATLAGPEQDEAGTSGEVGGEPGHAPLDEDGVYLVTGGTGGIVMEIVRHLAALSPATFILVSRSGSPEGTTRAAQRISAGVDAIEAAGATVEVRAVDVTDETAMRNLVAWATETYGPIRGAFHAAGTLDDAPIALKTAEDVDAVLAPKVDGTQVLFEVLSGQPLDLVVLFSSVSSLLGLPGQVDYCAANAYLDAAAHDARLRGIPAVAIDWCAWREVGMAAKLNGADEGASGAAPARTLGDHLASLPDGAAVDHATLSVREEAASGDTFYGVIDPEHWVVDEHRMPGGAAVFPGTGYVDLIVSAARSVWQGAAVEIRELMFSEPMYVSEPCTVRVEILPRRGANDEAADVVVASRAGERWRAHAEGVVALPAADWPDGSAPTWSSDGAVCTRETGFPVNHQARLLDLGPHWDVLDEMQMGIPFTRNGQGHPSAAIARLALRPEHAEGTASFSAHPALLDIATGFGLPVLDGYKDHGDFYVPLIYEGARFYAPLPNEVVSRMVCRDRTSRELASFEVTLWDRDGRCVAEIDTFTMKRVDPDQFTGSVPERRDEAAASTTNSSSGMALDMTQALTTKEGLAVLDRVLAHDCGPQVLVSTVNIDSLKRQIDEEYARPDASSLDGEENTEPAADNAPRDPVETQIAAIWASMLGVAHVGIHDDFFDLGGHSLIAVRVFARVKKEFGVDLPLSTILQAPTVAAYAEIVRQAKGLAFAPDAPGDAAGTVDRSSAASPGTRASGDGTSSAGAHADVEVGDTNRSSPPTVSVTSAFNPLVPIHTRGDGVPFFCVHGAGGGVLNFRDLAQHLKDRPFYGLQARGINGQFDPHTSIEDMAAEYVAAVRRAHPEGPYVLGGYSGGGVIAYEMAQQLLADGVEVPLLVFLDTFYPHLSSPRTDSLSSRLGERIEELRKNGWAFIADYIRTRIKVERNRILRVGTRLYDRLGRALPIAFREQVLVEAFHAAVNSYEPRYYPGQIVMFGAEDKGDYDGRVGDDLGWSAATGVEVTVYKIPGDHDNLVLPPNTERLARLLGRELRGAVEPTEVLEHQGAY